MKLILKTALIILSAGLFCDVNAQKVDDTSSIQNILDAYYESISGPIGKARDFNTLRSLFHPEARLIYNYWTEEGKAINTLIMTPEEFISKLDYTVKKGFY